MDAPKVAAMLDECNINSANARVLFWHLNQFFGRQIAVSEGTWHQYFWGMEFPLTTGCYTLEDKMPAFFWYKEPDELLQHQVSHVLHQDDVVDLTKNDFTLGGDHGKGKVQMILKMILCYDTKKESCSFLFQIAGIDYQKDTVEVLQNPVPGPLGVALKQMANGG